MLNLDIPIFLNQLFAVLFASAIPLFWIMLLLLVFVKIGKRIMRAFTS